ncbi:hypothetical protein NEMIN01_1489 [Nematocida minor]|uniref:uncharacterized protein n=1 Tax=Nematocida minor TaxID=1912983 RepID=UPI00221FEB54|nr:uncharacterized protein NEMIN01_1489 [Nematocida minor]KAI5191330.1 hypothetical protein NEMIN01_1489 [Nematocida minor]
MNFRKTALLFVLAIASVYLCAKEPSKKSDPKSENNKSLSHGSKTETEKEPTSSGFSIFYSTSNEASGGKEKESKDKEGFFHKVGSFFTKIFHRIFGGKKSSSSENNAENRAGKTSTGVLMIAGESSSDSSASTSSSGAEKKENPSKKG